MLTQVVIGKSMRQFSDLSSERFPGKLLVYFDDLYDLPRNVNRLPYVD